MLRLIKANSLFALLLLLSFSCNSPSTNKTTESAPLEAKLIDGHPDWIIQGNIYEVNIRQYTPEGTFKAFEKNLDRLKEMGVQTLWLMPINPISKLDHKGALGSYYAVADYDLVNPEYGTLDDWNALVKHAHELGFKVIIDWVPNHTGADHPWLTSHPDFYVLDSITHKPLSPFDWTDVRKLNYANPALRDSMISSMKYWLTESDIDGFRCDVAGDVPDDFWKTCITDLKKTKPGIFMLAETDKPSVHEDGFDASYPWAMFQMMKLVASGKRYANALDSVRNTIDSTYPANALKMYFTSNHDENSWNKADYGTMPGAEHAPFAVFTQTMIRSIPLIYSGQEEPVLDSISFFYKDTIQFKNYSRAKFYKTLLDLRKNNAALAANASFKKVAVGNEKAVYAYVREADGKKVLVILNLSNAEQKIKITDPSLQGNPYNVFMGTNEPVTDKEWKIEPWGYVIYTY
ncbi:MAG: alpha-glucosidase C-terminal domain-containing protein [Bacteroidetes bacterium]|nr:alpha-glucosidase C-terminal domain-containing protein [Bacteroidota bacterium]